jgi:hypothetical protein
MALVWVPVLALVGFQPWPRYLLPLVPLLALTVIPVHGDDKPVPSRVALLPVLALALLLGPAGALWLRIEPHDGRWEGFSEIAIAIEQLPAGAIVYYRDVGRPLAWYAADARATLLWAGPEWTSLDEAVAAPTPAPRHLILTTGDPIPPAAAGWRVTAQTKHFLLLSEPQP